MKVIQSSMQYIAELAAFRDLSAHPNLQSRIRLCESFMMLIHGESRRFVGISANALLCSAVFVLPHESVARQIVKWCVFHNAPFHQPIPGDAWKSVHKYKCCLITIVVSVLNSFRLIIGGFIDEAIRMIKKETVLELDPIATDLTKLLQSIPLLGKRNSLYLDVNIKVAVDPNNNCLTAAQFDQVFDLYRLKCSQFLKLVTGSSIPGSYVRDASLHLIIIIR
jgi:hypothetical protein